MNLPVEEAKYLKVMTLDLDGQEAEASEIKTLNLPDFGFYWCKGRISRIMRYILREVFDPLDRRQSGGGAPTPRQGWVFVEVNNLR